MRVVEVAGGPLEDDDDDDADADDAEADDDVDVDADEAEGLGVGPAPRFLGPRPSSSGGDPTGGGGLMGGGGGGGVDGGVAPAAAIEVAESADVRLHDAEVDVDVTGAVVCGGGAAAVRIIPVTRAARLPPLAACAAVALIVDPGAAGDEVGTDPPPRSARSATAGRGDPTLLPVEVREE